MIVDPKARNLKVSSIVIEKHYMTAEQMKEMPWDKKDEIIDAYKKLEQPIEVLEVYSYEDGFNILSGMDINHPTLMKSAKIDLSYKELKFEDVTGRWLGRGQVERLFEPQIIQNESIGYLLKGLKWSSMHPFQSRDQSVKGNLLSDVEDGEIITALSEITPIQMEERNLGAYRYIDTLLQSAVQTRTFTQDVIRGDRPPAGTPLGTSQLQASMAGGFFDLKREDIGLFLKEVFEDWVIPDFKKQNRKEHFIHVMKLLGDDASSKYLNAIIDNRVRKMQPKLVANGTHADSQMTEILRGTIADSVKNADMKIFEGLYDEFKYKVDVVITGEQIDLSSRITTAQVLLQLLFSNPMAMQDQTIKKVVYKVLEWSGINPDELVSDDVPSIQKAMSNIVPQGGSISVPKTNQPSMVTSQV
jgi:hypothetical protein